MQIDSKTAEALRRCIRSNIPFALIFMPNSVTSIFFASFSQHRHCEDVLSSKDCWQGLAISPFGLGKDTSVFYISNDLGVEDILSLPEDFTPLAASNLRLQDVSTEYEEYIKGVQYIIDILKDNHGKTVISRLIALKSSKDFVQVLASFFSNFPATLRFCYFMPQTGLWFGATPELLMDYDMKHHTFSTMSLAGTRTIENNNIEWDAKNISEHKYVTDYLMTNLQQYGLMPEIYDSTPLQYGAIEHLCDRIKAEGEIMPTELLNALSPTPAVCGYPKQEAYQQILSVEHHPRHCYSGWIALKAESRLLTYVNLRSAMAAKIAEGFAYNIWVGGGITSDSIPEKEWEETQQKASRLLRCITEEK